MGGLNLGSQTDHLGLGGERRVKYPNSDGSALRNYSPRHQRLRNLRSEGALRFRTAGLRFRRAQLSFGAALRLPSPPPF